MNYDIIRLDELISRTSVSSVRKKINNYECFIGDDIHSFLREMSIRFSKKDLSKTYLALNSDDEIMGYVTVGIKSFNLSSNAIEIPSGLYDLMNPYKGIVQSYLLGQLSRSRKSEKGFGTELLHYAIGLFEQHRVTMGCRVIRLECTDKLVGYYANNGFTKVKKDAETGLNQMVYILNR